MRKWIVALVGFALLWSIRPFRGEDAGSLQVVETLLIDEEQGQVHVASGELTGTGRTISEALENMSENTPGTLFLRQVRRIVLCGGQNKVQYVMELPDEIPVGAILYTSQESAEVLRQQETLEQVLAARERRDRTLPNLASVKNEWLERKNTGKAVG